MAPAAATMQRQIRHNPRKALNTIILHRTGYTQAQAKARLAPQKVRNNWGRICLDIGFPIPARDADRRRVRAQRYQMGWLVSPGAQRRRLNYAGKVDHGFDNDIAKDLQARLKPLVRKTQPYSKRIAHRGTWVEPSLLAEIEYRAKSAEGKVRHPVFKGLREDL